MGLEYTKKKCFRFKYAEEQIEEEKGDWIKTYFSGLGTSSKTLPIQNLTFTLLGGFV